MYAYTTSLLVGHARGHAGKKEPGTEFKHLGDCKNRITSYRQFLFFLGALLTSVFQLSKRNFLCQNNHRHYSNFWSSQNRSARFSTDEKDSESEEAGKRKDVRKLWIAWQALAAFVRMVERVQVASNKSREQQHCRSFHDLHRLQIAGKRNIFTSGCKNFQRLGLVRHMQTVDHKNAVVVIKDQEVLDVQLNLY